MRMLIGLGAAALAAVAMPAVAHATPHTTVYVLNHQLVIEAEPGKTNNIVIGMESASHRLIVTDSGDLLAVGAGCSLSGDIVRCSYESGTTKLITSVRVNAGDLNDRVNVTYDNTNADAMPAYVYGEAGNDVIETRAKGTISGGDGTGTLRPKPARTRPHRTPPARWSSRPSTQRPSAATADGLPGRCATPPDGRCALASAASFCRSRQVRRES